MRVQVAPLSSGRTLTVAIVVPYFYCFDRARADITKRVFRHYSSVPDSIFIGVGSEGPRSRTLLAEANPAAQYREFVQDWTYVPPSGNKDLRRKYNATVAAAREFDPEYVFCLGSDDLVPVEFFTPSGADLVGCGQGEEGGAYFWPYRSQTAYWWDGHSPFSKRGQFSGGVLGFSPKLLNALDWAPFQFDGDELGVEKFVQDDERFTLESRYGMQTWHPKSRSVLNTMTLIRTHLVLEEVDSEITKRFLDYWNTLDPTPLRSTMPINPDDLPALERELVHAKGTKPGGQPPDEGRIAAIEEAIVLHRQAAEDAKPKKSKPAKADKVAEAKAKDEAEKETAEAKPPEETADTTSASSESADQVKSPERAA